VTEHEIRQAVDAGCRGLTELTMRTGCGATCGSCLPLANALLAEAREDANPEAGTAFGDNIVAFPGISHAA
jgi:bacterioferritin-associated ferredoxin